jgi:membrane protein DedA with SNARE-associated domain
LAITGTLFIVDWGKMSAVEFVDYLNQSVGDPIVIATAIGLFTLVLEDAATMAGAIAASLGMAPVSMVLTALYVGILAGDIGLYGAGRLAGSYAWAQKFSAQFASTEAGHWADDNAVALLFGARFAPGLRLPTYVAAGMMRVPFRKFAATIAVAGAIWTPLLFSLAFWFGAELDSQMDSFRWIAPMILIFLVLFGPRAYRGLAKAWRHLWRPAEGSLRQ